MESNDSPDILRAKRTEEFKGADLFIYLLKAYSPVNYTGLPRGFSLGLILHESHTIQNTNVKHSKIQKLVPSVSLL